MNENPCGMKLGEVILCRHHDDPLFSQWLVGVVHQDARFNGGWIGVTVLGTGRCTSLREAECQVLGKKAQLATSAFCITTGSGATYICSTNVQPLSVLPAGVDIRDITMKPILEADGHAVVAPARIERTADGKGILVTPPTLDRYSVLFTGASLQKLVDMCNSL